MRIHLVVFTVGLIAIGALFVAEVKISDSESFLLLAALVSYCVYVMSSATLALSLTSAGKSTRAASYLFAMLPSVLLTSWMPITTSWPTDLAATIPWRIKATACVLSNVMLCYVTGLFLVWLAGVLSARGAWQRAAVFAAAIVLPIAFWVAQVEFVLHSKGLS
jgi:hypothetical protein